MANLLNGKQQIKLAKLAGKAKLTPEQTIRQILKSARVHEDGQAECSSDEQEYRQENASKTTSNIGKTRECNAYRCTGRTPPLSTGCQGASPAMPGMGGVCLRKCHGKIQQLFKTIRKMRMRKLQSLWVSRCIGLSILRLL